MKIFQRHQQYHLHHRTEKSTGTIRGVLLERQTVYQGENSLMTALSFENDLDLFLSYLTLQKTTEYRQINGVQFHIAAISFH